MHISIVIPVHNEAGNIVELIDEIVQLSLESAYQIIVVDDASDDDTAAVLAEKKLVTARLKVILHQQKYGQSAAIATGVAHAEGDLIVTMDGDGQNDPADIPELIAKITGNKSYRLVAGYRKNRHDSAWRVMSSKIANAVRRFFLHDDTPDTGCGLKVFYRSTFIALPFFDHMHRFLPALVQMQGGEVTSVVVGHRPREHGISNYGTLDRLWVGIVDLFGVSWLRLRSKNISIKEGSDV